MSDALAAEQRALLAALWTPSINDAPEFIAQHVHSTRTGGPFHLEKALQAYRGNGLGLAQRALPAAYPVLTRLVGEADMASLAGDFWRRHPPRHGDIARWGGGLQAFVRGAAVLADLPWLADVADVEWALHQSATAADGATDAASFALLVDTDPALVTLVLADGTAVRRSPWPVAELIAAHADGEPAPEVLDVLRDTLAACRADGPPQATLVWRQGLRPRCRAMALPEAAVVEALLRGESLADALAAGPDFAFGGWLEPAVLSGLVLGARPL